MLGPLVARELMDAGMTHPQTVEDRWRRRGDVPGIL
jgi:hypothetical protein